MKLKRIITFAVCLILVLGSIAHGAIIFSDDFESGNLDNWTVNLKGYPDEWMYGVYNKNGSNVAYLSMEYSFYESSALTMSKRFDYVPGATVAFDFGARYRLEGIRVEIGVDFYDSSERKIAGFSFITHGPQGVYNFMEFYDSYDFELDELLNYPHLSLDEIAFAELKFGLMLDELSRGYAMIFLDNVEVATVPCPGAFLLLGTGIVGLAIKGRFNVSTRLRSQIFQAA